jgi:hypothetical protein
LVVIAPDGLSLDNIDLIQDNKIRIKYFPAPYFSNVDSYSKLMLNAMIYESFIDYRYILIHQLDAFVFSDQLSDWCKLSYDYIGAPWIGEAWVDDFNKVRFGCLSTIFGGKRRTVGNGGFSLRKTRTFIFALWLLGGIAGKWTENEDLFWSFEVPNSLPFFRIPEAEMAVKFAFETKPRECFEKNNRELPFGCHAWEKHDIEFWRPIFSDLGYYI